MNTRHAPWSALVAALSVTALPAQQGATAAAEPSPEFAQIEIGKDGFVLPAGQVMLTQVIDRAAEFLRWNIMTWETEMANSHRAQQPLRFHRPLALDARGCEEVLRELLHMCGFVLLEMDSDKDLYEVVLLHGPRSREIGERAVHRTPEEILSRPNLKALVTTELDVEHLNANILCNALRPFFSMHGSQWPGSIVLAPAGNSSTIAISGFQHRVAHVIHLVRAADVPARPEPGPKGGE